MKIFVYERPWALLPEVLDALRNPQALGAFIFRQEAASRAASPAAGNGGAIAVLPLHGVILQRFGYLGTSVELFTQMLRHAVADPQISAIVLDVDSPGGEVSGVPELAAEILAARNHKKIVAVANSLAASSAYWIAAAASEFVVTPSAQVGSIGIYALHMDWSRALDSAGIKPTFISAGKFKTEGNQLEPISGEALGAIQKNVDAFYEMFIRDVARGRGVSLKAVRNGFGEGRMIMSAEAQELGMVDRIATLDETILRLAKSASRSANARACAVCAGTGRMVAMENGEPTILNEDCPGCQGSGEAAAEILAEAPVPAAEVPASGPSAPAVLDEPGEKDLQRLAAQHRNARDRARLLEMS